MTAIPNEPAVRIFERLLGLDRARGGAAAAPSDLAAALSLGNQVLSPSDLAAVLVRLSDDAWDQLREFRAAVARDRCSAAEPQTPFGQLFAMAEPLWNAVERFRAEHRAAERRRDASVMSVALGAIAVALTPPSQQTVADAAEGEAGDRDDPAMAAAEKAVADDRAGAFLANYRRIRAAAAAKNPELRTQKQLAAAAGVSAATINAIETGKVLPQLGTIVKLARALGVEPEALLAHR